MSILLPGQFSPMPGSFRALTLTNSAAQALTLTAGANGLPKAALVQAVGQSVNWRDDGVAPTADVGGGMVLTAGADPSAFVGNLSTAKFISTSVSNSTLLVSYYS